MSIACLFLSLFVMIGLLIRLIEFIFRIRILGESYTDDDERSTFYFIDDQPDDRSAD
jgi:hypothetical protein